MAVGGPSRVHAEDAPLEAARSLLGRVLGPDAGYFQAEIIPKDGPADAYEIESRGDTVVLRGTSGVAVASALNYYLKRYAHCDIGWNGTNLDLPHPLPRIPARVHRQSPYRFRYYLNYCTNNYSMSWWDWDRWQSEIDWMALNGINMPLALTGQNAVLRRVYKSMGFSDEDLTGFFSGPAYFSWFWMANLDGWGGPLTPGLIDRQEALQRRILDRERGLGMTPVLPAFAGHIPLAFRQRFPAARTKTTNWNNGFPDVLCLDPDDPAFVEVGRRVMAEEIRTFGTDHLYSADTFNENQPPTNDPAFLTQVSRKVYQSMTAVDPAAVWVMQGWLFANDRAFWQPAQVKALLDGVPDQSMVVLDLYAEVSPVWKRTDGFYGKPWIWCMLHNFGGRVSMFGRMDHAAADPAAAHANPAAGRMAGIGLTPEAIEQNPVMYELMQENAWTDRPIDLEAWLPDYVRRRYGRPNAAADTAWRVLRRTVYAGLTERAAESIITGRPTLERSTVWTHTDLGYAPRELLPAWDQLVAAAGELGGSDGFRYDLVDLTRQVLANHGATLQQQFAADYRARDLAAFRVHSGEFLALLADLDRLLGSRRDFLLGRWLRDARAAGATPAEKDLCERNARDLITLWGGPESRLHEYAGKQWAGMLSGFYAPRWQRYFGALEGALQQHGTIDQGAFDLQMAQWEWRWVQGHETYPAAPRGDSIALARELHAKYRPALGDE